MHSAIVDEIRAVMSTGSRLIHENLLCPERPSVGPQGVPRLVLEIPELYRIQPDDIGSIRLQFDGQKAFRRIFIVGVTRHPGKGILIFITP